MELIGYAKGLRAHMIGQPCNASCERKRNQKCTPRFRACVIWSVLLVFTVVLHPGRSRCGGREGAERNHVKLDMLC